MVNNNGNIKIPGIGKTPKKHFLKKKKVRSKKNLKETVKKDKACISCSSTNGITAHHIKFKSEGGDDSIGNLITLCFDCHRKAHDGYYTKRHKKDYFCDFINPSNFMIELLYKINIKKYQEVLSWLYTKAVKDEV